MTNTKIKKLTATVIKHIRKRLKEVYDVSETVYREYIYDNDRKIVGITFQFPHEARHGADIDAFFHGLRKGNLRKYFICTDDDPFNGTPAVTIVNITSEYQRAKYFEKKAREYVDAANKIKRDANNWYKRMGV